MIDPQLRLTLWILGGVLAGGYLGSYLGTTLYSYEKPVGNCDAACVRQVTQMERDCLDPSKPSNGCPGPVGPSGRWPGAAP